MPSFRQDGSRYLALLGYCLVVLMGAPIASISYQKANQMTEQKIISTYFSPIECAALALLDFSPSLEPVVPRLLLPTSILKHGVKIMSECLQPDSDPSSCKLQSYLNISQAQRLGSVELKQLQTLLEKAFTPNQLTIVYIGSMIVVLGAVGALIRPIKASILGFPLIAASVYSAKPAGFLATFAILFFLAVFAICDVEDLRLPRLNAVRRARREAKRL